MNRHTQKKIQFTLYDFSYSKVIRFLCGKAIQLEEHPNKRELKILYYTKNRMTVNRIF